MSDSFGLFPGHLPGRHEGLQDQVYRATRKGTDDPPMGDADLLGGQPPDPRGWGDVYPHMDHRYSLDSNVAGQDALILADAEDQAPFTVTLYSAAGREGQYVTVKKVDSTDHVVTIMPIGNELIDNSGTYELLSALSFVRLRSTGTKWIRVASDAPSVAGFTWADFE